MSVSTGPWHPFLVYLKRNMSLPVPLVVLLPVTNLPLGITTRIFEKIRKGWRKLIHVENLKSKISWHCPFNPPQLILASFFQPHRD
jgi:hypothetical protein